VNPAASGARPKVPLIVPTTDTANQSLLLTLNNQSCQINAYQKQTGFFLDLYVDNVLILGGVLCRNQCFLIMNIYLGFVGDLMWVDTQNQNADPVVGGGIGTRFQLVYLLPADIPVTALFAGQESAEQNPVPGFPS
jgi:hypothetical protein